MEEGRRYFVINMVRREETRLLRIQSPAAHRFVQLVCKNRFRIGRGQNVQISEEILHDCWDELELKQRRGIVVVRADHPTAGPKFLFENRPTTLERVEPTMEQVVEPAQVVETSEPEIVVEPVQVEPEPEPVRIDPEPTQEPVPEPSPKADPTRMKKSELIRYVAELMGEDTDQYESMTKKELLELVQ